MNARIASASLPVLLLLAVLSGCATASLVENARGRPERAAERGFAVELKEAFLHEDGKLVLVGYRDTIGGRQTWAVRLMPPFESPVAVPWKVWHRADEPRDPVVLLPDDGACSFAGRMREEHRSIPVYATEPLARSSGEAVIVRRSPIRLSGRDARTAEPQVVVLLSSSDGSAELRRVEVSFLEDVRPSRPKPAYLLLLPFSLALDAAITGAGLIVATPILTVQWLTSSEAPAAEVLEDARTKGCRCLSREGAGEVPTYWACYEPLLL